jgi:FG-GAP-like repeat
MNRLLVPAVCIATVIAARAQAPVPAGEFTKIQLTDQFWAEGAHFGDFNKDGKMDVVYGPYWFEGPDFTKRHAYSDDSKTSKVKNADGSETTIAGFKGALSNENEYSKNFLAFTHDFNGDGWTDILILGFPGEHSWWFENPQGRDEKWKQHVAIDVTDNESPTFTDITGDGRPEIVCSSRGFLGYAEFDPKNPTAKWAWRSISPKGPWQRFTHGFGVGDVNGDGRLDILEKDGWWEQPATLDGDPLWTKHDAMFGSGGAQMFACDVSGDGKNDVITSLEAHGYGVAWFEQTNEGGVPGWTKHTIVGVKPEENPQGIQFTQPHALALADMNGDGLMDIVTGKRFWAHGPKGDKDPNATPVLYWFELKRAGGKAEFVGHLIDDRSGVGTQVVAGDLNGDKKPDVVVGNKRGAFVFLRK